MTMADLAVDRDAERAGLGGHPGQGRGGARGAGRRAGRRRRERPRAELLPLFARSIEPLQHRDVALPPGAHPTDADREAAALPVLLAAVGAARARDGASLRQAYADDAVWLAPGETLHGGDAAAERHLAIAAGADSWDEPQQQGAKAVLRWSGGGGASGALVVEVRRERIIFAATA